MWNNDIQIWKLKNLLQNFLQNSSKFPIRIPTQTQMLKLFWPVWCPTSPLWFHKKKTFKGTIVICKTTKGVIRISFNHTVRIDYSVHVYDWYTLSVSWLLPLTTYKPIKLRTISLEKFLSEMIEVINKECFVLRSKVKINIGFSKMLKIEMFMFMTAFQ